MISSISGQNFYAGMFPNAKRTSTLDFASQKDLTTAMFAGKSEETVEAREKSVAGGGVTTSLSSSELKDLASKYDPTNMSQEEYEKFLDELHEQGMIDEEDLLELEHSDYVPSVQKVSLEHGCITTLANGADLPSGGKVIDFSMGAKRVNVLYWAQYEKSFKYYDSEQADWVPTNKATAFEKIYDVLAMMGMYQ